MKLEYGVLELLPKCRLEQQMTACFNELLRLVSRLRLVKAYPPVSLEVFHLSPHMQLNPEQQY